MRRWLSRLCLLGLLWLLLGCWVLPREEVQRRPEFPDGVAAGDVRPQSAILWTRVDQARLVTLELSTDVGLRRDLLQVQTVSRPEDDFIVKLDVRGLIPDQRYFYRFRAGDATSRVGTFRTPPLPETPRDVRFVFAGDSDGSGAIPIRDFFVLREASRERPDFWLYMGDTVYMDTFPPIAEDLDTMRQKYRINRRYPGLRELLAQAAVYALWSDHEIRNNFTRETVDPDLFAAGRRAFSEYMPIREQAEDLGFYRRFRWGKHVDLFLLDSRSFRSAEALTACQDDLAPTLPAQIREALGLPPMRDLHNCLRALHDPSRTFLGPRQKALFTEALQSSDATWKIIVSDVPFSQLFLLPYDRWEGYAYEREQILELVRDIPGVVFLAADIHSTVVVDVKHPRTGEAVAKEFIVGPIAQRTMRQELLSFVGSRRKARDVSALASSLVMPDCFFPDTYAYGLVEVKGDTREMRIDFKSASGDTLCTATLKPLPEHVASP